jgi:hypothetical protein
MNAFLTRTFAGRGLLTIAASAALVAGLPAPGSATGPAPASVAAVAAAVGEDGEATLEEKVRAAREVGLVADAVLLGYTDRNFVIAIWQHVDGNPQRLEVRAAAARAFTGSDADCTAFITTEIFAASRRDTARNLHEAELRRARHDARSRAAASVGIVANAAMLDVSDRDFAYAIYQRLNATDWPKARKAALDAFGGTLKQQQTFIASGLAKAANQDKIDRINRDDQATEQEKARQRSRASKELAAIRVGLAVTDTLLNLPDQDFIREVWNATPDGSQVQAAAIAALRSTDPAAWKAFIDTGIHQALQHDIDLALAAQAKKDRALTNDVLKRAEKAGDRNLALAARNALAGSDADVADFVNHGQYDVRPDLPDTLQATHSGQCLGVWQRSKKDGAHVVQWPCIGGTYADHRWRVLPRGSYVEIHNNHTGKCLAVDKASKSSGAHVFQWRCTGAKDQQWAFVATQGYDTKLRNRNSGQCLTIDGGNKAKGAHAVQRPCGGTTKGQGVALRSRGLRELESGRFNNDGYDDLIAADVPTGKLWLYPGTATGIGFGARVQIGAGWQDHVKLSAGEFTGDGFDDLVAVDRKTGKLWLYPGTADGQLQSRRLEVAKSGWNDLGELTSGEFTGDGHGDLIALEHKTGKLWLYPGTSTAGRLGARVEVAKDWSVMAKIGAGTYDGDAFEDLTAVEKKTGNLFLFPGTGKGKFGPRVRIGTASWNGYGGLLGGRFDRGNQVTDLLAVDGATGKLFRYSGLGTGQLGTRTEVGIGE